MIGALRVKTVLFNSAATQDYIYMFDLHSGPLPHLGNITVKTHTIKNTVMKQSRGLNGDLKPEHKKTTNRTSMSPTTDFDSQASTI